MALTSKQILDLVDAGFTRSQIETLDTITASQAPDPVPAPAPEPVPAPVAPAPEPEPQPGSYDAIMREIAALRASVQTAAINNAHMPDTHQATADDILAHILGGDGQPI